ncbi:MAG: hypothetical protein ACJAUW_001463 [Yoonia sp.]|jgi:hypothetical protein
MKPDWLNLRLNVVPYNRLGDRIIAWKKFLARHRRLPSQKKMLWNDVLYRLKTSDALRDPLRVFVSDKEHVKDYVKAVAGDHYNVPTIDVIRNVDSVRTYPFPPNCCIKPTQASGQVILRKGNAPLDLDRIESWFKLNQYHAGREINYRYLKPKIIIEPLIFDTDNIEDYKFFCYDGVPKIVQVDVDRQRTHERSLLDMQWRDLGWSIIYPKADEPPAKPANFDEMRALASTLSAGFDGFIRIDLYSNGSQIYLGEITNVSGNAQGNFRPPEAEVEASKILFSN